MKRLRIATIIVIALMFVSVNVLWAEDVLRPEEAPSVNWPPLDKLKANKNTVKELTVFYKEMEAALHNEDIKSLMGFYTDDYLHHGITKRELRFMWLEILNNYDSLYSSHILTKVDQSGAGGDIILVCTGGLFGIPHGSKTGEFEAVDSWSKVNHWLYKIKGDWKIVGGGSHKTTGVLGEEFHPLF